jgi:hypothetical protein
MLVYVYVCVCSVSPGVGALTCVYVCVYVYVCVCSVSPGSIISGHGRGSPSGSKTVTGGSIMAVRRRGEEVEGEESGRRSAIDPLLLKVRDWRQGCGAEKGMEGGREGWRERGGEFVCVCVQEYACLCVNVYPCACGAGGGQSRRQAALRHCSW